MIVLEVLLNGAPLYTISHGNRSLEASVTWQRVENEGGITGELIFFSGMARDDSFKRPSRWPVKELNVGDEITVRIVDRRDPTPDGPTN